MRPAFVPLFVAIAAAASCGDDGSVAESKVGTGGTGGSAGGASGTAGGDASGGVGGTTGIIDASQPDLPPVTRCGDGSLDEEQDEECDDRNVVEGDGCTMDCKLEPGWYCPTPGTACEAAECGDGILAGSEQCEDGGAPPVPADGCDAECRREPGFACPTPGVPCHPTVCGDANPEGDEQCDDGNNDTGDGCTPFCVREPDCSMGACTSACGDGIRLPGGTEQCEDGNTTAGDGCSSDCQLEPGFDCTDVPVTEAVLVLPIVLRDFSSSHPDMESFLGSEQGIVSQTLGPDAKPVYANPGGSSATTSGQAAFDQWYRDVPGVNMTAIQSLTLNQLPTGEFQFSSSNYFPLNGIGFGNEGRSNNFHFTSEVRYWFEYKGSERFDFTGDDDVWVFVNRRLAVDLGGVHGAQSGGVTLSTIAATHGLEVGKVYEIAVFQAERHTSQSNYRLTLSNFVNTITECQSVCGDGVVTPDEQCDDGVNDGGYGECGPGCLLGEHCGDGVVQPAEEQCDDGNHTNGDGCESDCTLLVPA